MNYSKAKNQLISGILLFFLFLALGSSQGIVTVKEVANTHQVNAFAYFGNGWAHPFSSRFLLDQKGNLHAIIHEGGPILHLWANTTSKQVIAHPIMGNYHWPHLDQAPLYYNTQTGGIDFFLQDGGGYELRQFSWFLNGTYQSKPLCSGTRGISYDIVWNGTHPSVIGEHRYYLKEWSDPWNVSVLWPGATTFQLSGTFDGRQVLIHSTANVDAQGRILVWSDYYGSEFGNSSMIYHQITPGGLTKVAELPREMIQSADGTWLARDSPIEFLPADNGSFWRLVYSYVGEIPELEDLEAAHVLRANYLFPTPGGGNYSVTQTYNATISIYNSEARLGVYRGSPFVLYMSGENYEGAPAPVLTLGYWTATGAFITHEFAEAREIIYSAMDSFFEPADESDDYTWIRPPTRNAQGLVVPLVTERWDGHSIFLLTNLTTLYDLNPAYLGVSKKEAKIGTSFGILTLWALIMLIPWYRRKAQKNTESRNRSEYPNSGKSRHIV
ncbi:MAG: hypothetical protein ACXACI_14105 [Candidatus Hodarchaeales archaeon]|jgi:hypothetical protein